MTAANVGPRVTIVIPARNESGTIAKVVRQARLVEPGSEIIVVCNGSTDKTAVLAKKAGASKVLTYPASLGYDVGRSLGAKHASGDILLFMDADFAVPSGLLKEYVHKIEEGWDLALNKYSGISQKHPVNAAKYLLNDMLGRPDLQGSSMTTVPHALSRHALEVIGIETLCVPPLAHAKALLSGLPVTACALVNTTKLNRRRPGRKENVMNLILGDHSEAISYLISQRGNRGGWTDYGRLRHIAGAPDNDNLLMEAKNRGGTVQRS